MITCLSKSLFGLFNLKFNLKKLNFIVFLNLNGEHLLIIIMNERTEQDLSLYLIVKQLIEF